ncbi:GNAT family N-acetyltransferase [Plantactinospora endophytica]|uniref:GCN5 family N-acetyltransferase n=1 Tax=Plantactinospora endophytica TaxID=673535 RepID=A0ABQ4EDN7_9ACTN|nr:GNAT family N-acetyltransferase [Plantactinospora endophytica]GIG92835.1 GCN5 family N-acetyltransferase [Plantactinospora endophytica]
MDGPHGEGGTGSADQLVVRPGGAGDVAAVLALLDGATRWLVERGRTGQWGSTPHSGNPRRIAQVRRWAADGALYLAELAGRPVGAIVVGTAVPHVPPATEPELYVNLLVTDRAQAGRRIGARLLEYAEDLARAAGVDLLRVDCYAGDDGALIRYYESQGFTVTEPFTVPLADRQWPGQVLERRLSRPADDSTRPGPGAD